MGRVAVVTGGASGMSRSICEHFARRGDRVGVLDINGEGATAVADELRAEGAAAIGCAVDVADRASIEDAIGRVRSELGPVEILVTGAAISKFELFTDISVESWQRVLSVNLTGTFHCIQVAIPDMIAAGWGRIVTISSSAGQVGTPMHAHYAASKGGVIALTRALAFDYARMGITVNNIAPHYIDTPMFRAGIAATRSANVATDADGDRLPVGRLGTGDDIAACCMYLTSDEASFITGQLYGVNGGALP